MDGSLNWICTDQILPPYCHSHASFCFGGGFKEGERDAKIYSSFFNYFASKGFTVASIDYRLGGMKGGQKAPGLFNYKPIQNSISLAVADLYSATSYLLENAEELYIDPSLIIISGSSAGAITVLQADYRERDNHPSASVLPDNFRYAGVIAFAGGIFSTEGVPSYAKKSLLPLFSSTAVPISLYHTTTFDYSILACSDLNRWRRDSVRNIIHIFLQHGKYWT